MSEDKGERAMGTPNTIYDLSSVLYHALKGGAVYDQYIQDAEAAGDWELVDFFGRVQDEDSIRGHEAQLLLAERTPTVARTETMAPGVGTSPTLRPGPEDPSSPRQEGTRRPEQEEDRRLLDKAIDKLTGEEEPRRE